MSKILISKAFVVNEGYYIEWDVFNDVPVNEELLKILKEQ